jgi:DNA (cytosine-5)-methyltransferase 1
MIKHIFTNVLRYRITEPQLLNASDFGIPQTRRRVFVVGIREDIKCDEFSYPSTIGCKFTMQDFLEENCARGCFTYDKDGNVCIEKSPGDREYIEKFILTPKVRDYVLSSGTKNFKTSTKTDMEIARTLLKTMTQHHRAGVDNYVSLGIDSDGKRILRALTDRECLRLMGYSDDFKIVVSPMQIYRQAGNSIVVDVIMAILRQLMKTGVFNN